MYGVCFRSECNLNKMPAVFCNNVREKNNIVNEMAAMLYVNEMAAMSWNKVTNVWWSWQENHWNNIGLEHCMII